MIRPYAPSDRALLDALYERNGGNPWSFPDPGHRSTLQVFVVEEGGRVTGAIAAIAMMEVCLAVDHTVGTPRERLTKARALIEEGCRWAYGAGFSWAYTPVPKEISGWFRKLKKFIGVKDDDRVHGILDLQERYEWSLSSPPASESKTSA
jgi:hypothetical protein